MNKAYFLHYETLAKSCIYNISAVHGNRTPLQDKHLKSLQSVMQSMTFRDFQISLGIRESNSLKLLEMLDLLILSILVAQSM